MLSKMKYPAPDGAVVALYVYAVLPFEKYFHLIEFKLPHCRPNTGGVYN